MKVEEVILICFISFIFICIIGVIYCGVIEKIRYKYYTKTYHDFFLMYDKHYNINNNYLKNKWKEDSVRERIDELYNVQKYLTVEELNKNELELTKLKEQLFKLRESNEKQFKRINKQITKEYNQYFKSLEINKKTIRFKKWLRKNELYGNYFDFYKENFDLKEVE